MTKKTNKMPISTTPEGFPQPPATLPPAQVELWNAFVSSFPSDYFRTSDLPLITELCRAVATADFLASRIESTHATPEELKRLLALRDVESRRAASLSKALRAAPSARYDRQQTGVELRKTRTPWAENPFAQFVNPPRGET